MSMATIIKGSTKRGQNLIERGSQYEGYTLNQVYDSWSTAKENAYNWCFEKYRNTPESSAFSIISHNTFSFSVSWLGLYEGENAMFIETSSNSYIILLDR